MLIFLPCLLSFLPIFLTTGVGASIFSSLELLGSYFGVPGQNATFDYVIIGGGIAGLTLANRLSANYSVAVIEAGDFYEFVNGNKSQVPAYASAFTGSNPVMKNLALDWYMYTVPQPSLNNQELLYDSGKVISGSSARNFLWYTRGSSGAFSKWASEVGDSTYELESFTDHFQKSVHFNLRNNYSQSRETGGPVQGGYAAWTNAITRWLTEGFTELGLESLSDFSCGIGPAAILRQHGIDIIADRPGVGQNMMDNVLVGPTYEVGVMTHNSLANPAYLSSAIQQYNKNRTGMLTNVGGDVAGFELIKQGAVNNSTYRSILSSFPMDWPNLQYLVLDAYFGAGNDSSTGITDGKQYVTASVGLVSTFSRGNVSIRSSDTAVNPIISPNWLSDPRDMEMAVLAFKRGRDLFSSKALKNVTRREAFPDESVRSDDQIVELIRKSANSVYNAAGTNKMGKSNDMMAVVDSQARVIGVKNLRVVDASAFPFLPPGQPQATVYALAEKIASEILESRLNSLKA